MLRRIMAAPGTSTALWPYPTSRPPPPPLPSSTTHPLSNPLLPPHLSNSPPAFLTGPLPTRPPSQGGSQDLPVSHSSHSSHSHSRSAPSLPYPTPIKQHSSYPSLRNILNADTDDQPRHPALFAPASSSRHRSASPTSSSSASSSPAPSTPSAAPSPNDVHHPWPFAYSLPAGIDAMDLDSPQRSPNHNPLSRSLPSLLAFHTRPTPNAETTSFAKQGGFADPGGFSGGGGGGGAGESDEEEERGKLVRGPEDERQLRLLGTKLV